MEHSFYKDRLSAYLDNELPSQERELMEQHLAHCEECQELLNRLREFDRFVAEHAELSDSDYWEQSAQKIEQRLEQESTVTPIAPSSRWLSRLVKIAPIAASVAILAFISLYNKDISQPEQVLRAPSIPAEKRKAPLPSGKIQEAQFKLPEKRPAKGETSSPRAKSAGTAGEATISPPAGQEEAFRMREGMAAADKIAPLAEASSVDVELEPVEGPEPVPEPAPVEVEEIKEVPISKAAQPYETIARRKPLQNLAAGKVSAGIPESWYRPASIEKWRHRRDSLQTLLAEITSPHKELASGKARRLTPLPPKEEVQKLLLWTNYRIAETSPDEKERRQAIDYLTRAVTDTTSPWSVLAQQCLEWLKDTAK